MRIASYARLSVSVDTSVSIEGQQRIIAAWAEGQGGTIVGEFVDDGFSGSKDIERPAYDRLCADVKAGLFDVVAVKSLDRLGRRLTAFVQFVDLCQQHGARLVAIESGLDTATPTGRMMLSLLSTFAEFEAAQIGQRQATSQAQRRAVGRATTKAGLGFRNVKRDGGTWREIDPDGAAIIRRIYTDLVGGMSLRACAMGLNADGITSSKGAKFTASQVMQVMRNPVLAGYRVHRGEIEWDQHGEAIRDETLAILSGEEWLALTRVLADRGVHRIRSSDSPPLLLHRLAVCGNCGKHLGKSSTTTPGGQVPVYRCLGRVRGECVAPVSIRASELDGHVLAWLAPLGALPFTEARLIEDSEALQRRALLDAEVEALAASLPTATPSDIVDIAQRIADLRQRADNIIIETRVEQITTGETFSDMLEHQPRRAINSVISEIIVGSGRGTDRVMIVPTAELEY